MVHAFNPSTWKEGVSLLDQGQLGLQSKFQDSQGYYYIEIACLRKQKQQQKREAQAGVACC